MEQHLYSICNATDNLVMLDHPIPDMDLTAVIPISLPLLYDLLIDWLDYIKGLKLNINHVIAHILECD